MSEEVGYVVGGPPGEINHYATRTLGWQRMGRESWRDDEGRLIRLIPAAEALRDASSGARVYFPEITDISLHQSIEAMCHMYDLELRLV